MPARLSRNRPVNSLPWLNPPRLLKPQNQKPEALKLLSLNSAFNSSNPALVSAQEKNTKAEREQVRAEHDQELGNRGKHKGFNLSKGLYHGTTRVSKGFRKGTVEDFLNSCEGLSLLEQQDI